MSDAKDLEIEISTEGARSLLEIGFDLGVQATLTALGISGEDGPGPPNPFRRASTVIVEPKCAQCKHSLDADGRCLSSGCDCDCDNSDTGRLPAEVVKQLERVEADAAANARARAACACTRDKLDPECGLHGVTAEMSEAMTLLEGLSENRRGRVLCWFCPACHRYVGPGDSCTCQAEE